MNGCILISTHLSSAVPTFTPHRYPKTDGQFGTAAVVGSGGSSTVCTAEAGCYCKFVTSYRAKFHILV